MPLNLVGADTQNAPAQATIPQKMIGNFAIVGTADLCMNIKGAQILFFAHAKTKSHLKCKTCFMTFGDFLRNYLNPFYLLWRCSLLCSGAGALALAIFADSPSVINLAFGALGLWLCWMAIKPWRDGRGKSISDLNEQLRAFRKE